MTAAELEALLAAHAYLRVERPPEIWAPASELEPFIRLLGEMISAGLVRNGQDLGELTLNVSNVTVPQEAAGAIPAGDFVAVTILGDGDWHPETMWPADARLVSRDLSDAAAGAGVASGYTRVLGDGRGSVTVLVPRSHPNG